MNSIVEAEVRDYLRYRLRYDPYQCGAIMQRIRRLARMAGHDLDHRFAHAGLGAGPEARVAYAVRKEIGGWLRTSPPTGMIA